MIARVDEFVGMTTVNVPAETVCVPPKSNDPTVRPAVPRVLSVVNTTAEVAENVAPVQFGLTANDVVATADDSAGLTFVNANPPVV